MSAPAISVQLYSIHQALDQDLDGSLARLADIGLQNVEAFDFVRRADALRESLDRHRLSSPTAHAIIIEQEGVVTPDGLLSVPPAEQTFAAAASLGVNVVFDPFVAPNRWTSLSDVQRSAETLNARAEQAASYGLRVGYHNHDHELSSRIEDRPALEVFAELLDPSVLLEVDLYWAAAGGVDPVGLLQRLGDRVHAVHAKDGLIRPGITSREMPADQLPAGRGDVPLTEALAAGTSVAYAVIEFDRYEGDIFEGIAESYEFLTATL
jgi:sugar phosphate isomerase/epimerase